MFCYVVCIYRCVGNEMILCIWLYVAQVWDIYAGIVADTIWKPMYMRARWRQSWRCLRGIGRPAYLNGESIRRLCRGKRMGAWVGETIRNGEIIRCPSPGKAISAWVGETIRAKLGKPLGSLCLHKHQKAGTRVDIYIVPLAHAFLVLGPGLCFWDQQSFLGLEWVYPGTGKAFVHLGLGKLFKVPSIGKAHPKIWVWRASHCWPR